MGVWSSVNFYLTKNFIAFLQGTLDQKETKVIRSWLISPGLPVQISKINTQQQMGL